MLNEQQKLAEEKKFLKKEEDQKTMKEYMKITEEVAIKKESERVARLQAGKALEEIHLKHMVRFYFMMNTEVCILIKA